MWSEMSEMLGPRNTRAKHVQIYNLVIVYAPSRIYGLGDCDGVLYLGAARNTQAQNFSVTLLKQPFLRINFYLLQTYSLFLIFPGRLETNTGAVLSNRYNSHAPRSNGGVN
jgi:hypothetical protein